MTLAQRRIELISPSNETCEICPWRRSVRSYVEIGLFPFDESGCLSAVNNTFLSFDIRDKKPKKRGAQ
jgi:hypothetical protein